VGSELYRARVAAADDVSGPSDAHFSRRFGPELGSILADLGMTVRVAAMTFPEFLPLAVGALRRRGLEEAVAMVSETLYYDSSQVPAVRAGVSTLPTNALRKLDFWLFGHLLLRESFPEDVPAVKARRIRLQALQIHPDAPPVLEGRSDPLAVETFCMRLLSEATSDDPPLHEPSPFFRHFEKYGRNTWYDLGEQAVDDVLGLIWSADVVSVTEVERRGEVSAPDDGRWWESDPELEMYLEVGERAAFAEYDVVVHPEWVGRLPTKPFFSRAY
jgi:hypothetical protein